MEQTTASMEGFPAPISGTGTGTGTCTGVSWIQGHALALLEHHGAVAVHQHAVLEMPAHGAPEHAALHVSTLADQIADRVLVRRADHVLLDDRPLVERLRGVVRGGTDQLHAALSRLMVGLSPGEGRQK